MAVGRRDEGRVGAGVATTLLHGREEAPVTHGRVVADKQEETATQVANGEAEAATGHALDELERVWKEQAIQVKSACGAERRAQAKEDTARWRQAKILAEFRKQSGSHGPTYEAIAKKLGKPVSTLKLYVGMHHEFVGRTDLSERRFSDWGKIRTAIRSEMKRIKRMVPDYESLERLTAAVEEKLTGVIDGVVADEKLKTTRDFGQKTRDTLRQLVRSEHARLFPPPRPTGDPLRLTDGVDLLTDQDDLSVSIVLLDAPYGTLANPRGVQMANNSPEEARDLLIRIAPAIAAKLAENGFVFWFRPGFRIDATDKLKSIFAEQFCIRQLVWFKTRAGLSGEGKNIGSCHELIYLLWPRDRSQPVPHIYLPDCFYIPHDGMSGSNSPHPSAKPVALFEMLFEATTMPGDLIVDPFAGSGAAVEAALRLERRVVAAEIVPEIFELAQQRTKECEVDLANDPVTAAFAAERGIAII